MSLPIQSKLCTALMRLGTHMVVVLDQELAPLGINQAQFRTMALIREYSEMTPSHIAEKLLIDRATVTAITERMVKAGWIERRPGPDRRSHLLALTEAGRLMVERAVVPAHTRAQHILSFLTPEDAEVMERVLAQVETILRDTRK